MFRKRNGKKPRRGKMSYSDSSIKGTFHVQDMGRSQLGVRIFAAWSNGGMPYEVKKSVLTSARCVGVWRKANSGAESFTTYSFPGNGDLPRAVREYAKSEGLSSEGRHMPVAIADYIITGGGLIKVDSNGLTSMHRIYSAPAEGGEGDVQGDDSAS